MSLIAWVWLVGLVGIVGLVGLVDLVGNHDNQDNQDNRVMEVRLAHLWVDIRVISRAVPTFLAFGWKVLWGSIIRIKCRQRLSGELGEGAWQSSCSSTTGSPRPRLHLRPRLQHLHLLHRGWLSGCLRNGSSSG